VSPTPGSPRWMSVVLVLAGVYNLTWAAWASLFPAASFAYSGFEQPDRPLHYPQLWQSVGMFVGLFGVAYLLAARDPVRYWPLVFVGALGKFLAPVGLAVSVLANESPARTLVASVPNDLIWWVPFVLILRHAYRVNRVTR
jgi:small multidrug resistance pump